MKIPVSRVEDCTVTAYTGSNATSGVIASAEIEPTGRWTVVRGNFTARWGSDVLTVGAECDGEDGDDAGIVYLDEVVVGRRGC